MIGAPIGVPSLAEMINSLFSVNDMVLPAVRVGAPAPRALVINDTSLPLIIICCKALGAGPAAASVFQKSIKRLSTVIVISPPSW